MRAPKPKHFGLRFSWKEVEMGKKIATRTFAMADQHTPTSPKEKLQKALDEAIKSGELDRKDDTVFPKVIRELPYGPSIFTPKEIKERVEKNNQNVPQAKD